MKRAYKAAAFWIIVLVNVVALVGYIAGPLALTSGSMRDLWPAVPLLTLAIMTFVAWAGGRDFQ